MSRRASGEGSIGRRKDGTYYGTVRLDGQRHWVYGETRRVVADKLKELRRKHDQGMSRAGEKLTVVVFLNRWLEQVIKQRNKPRTYESYKQLVDNHITPKLGTIQLTALRPDHVQTLVNDLSKGKRAPRTVRNVRAVLRQALNQAMRWRYVSFNAATLVELPRIKKFEIEPLTREEARRFLDVIRGQRLEALYVMTLLLGLREGEVLGLLIANLDFEKGAVKIDGTLQWHSGKLVRESVKTSSSARTLPLPTSLVPLLKEHLARQQAKFPDNEYVFASTRGTPISCFNLLKESFAEILCLKSQPPTGGMRWLSPPISATGGGYGPPHSTTHPARRPARFAGCTPAGPVSDRHMPGRHPGLAQRPGLSHDAPPLRRSSARATHGGV